MRAKDETKRQVIAEAAITLINEVGFDGMAMSKIAAKAKVAPATIYIYYKNKEHLLDELYDSLKTARISFILKDFDPKIDVKKNMLKIWDNLFEYGKTNPDNFLFLEQYNNSPLAHKRALQKMNDVDDSSINNLLNHGKRVGIIKPLPNELIIAFFFRPLIHLLKKHLNKEIKLSGDMRKLSRKMAWGSIKGKG